jgi:prepilin-type N-terminal cleavage/methylation domain-containing protein
MTDTQTSSAAPARRVHDGFTLIELMLVLALITLLMWIAVPRYGLQQAHGRSAAMRLELSACVQTLHGLALAAGSDEDSPWVTLADSSGDGVGDAAEGPLAQAPCDISAGTRGSYDIRVIGNEAEFELQAHPQFPSDVGVYAVDHFGRQHWLDAS